MILPMNSLEHFYQNRIKERLIKNVLTNKSFYLVLVIGPVFWLIAIYSFAAKYTINMNLTPSLPFSLIVTTNDFTDDDIKRDTIISFPLGFDTSYEFYKKDTIFGKKIACLPGDFLEQKNLEYYCNGTFILSALSLDSKGKPLKQFKFNGVVPQNKYFVMGEHSNSFDSRYWGFVDRKKITGVSVWKY